MRFNWKRKSKTRRPRKNNAKTVMLPIVLQSTAKGCLDRGYVSLKFG